MKKRNAINNNTLQVLSIYYRLLIKITIGLLAVFYPSLYSFATTDCQYSFSDQIPKLGWKERSDWINVKTDVEPPSIGDGIQDDTDSIQAAINLIGPRPGDAKVVYLPAGKYKITDTLILKKIQGGMIVGNGRDTEITWAGKDNGVMIWSNGFSRSSYKGFILEGNNLAGVGIDHASKTLYETSVIHKHIVFRNFKIAGVRYGHNQKIASAEQLFFNCIFENNKNGALFMDFNDYNNVFDGAHFINNNTAINVQKGHIVARNVLFKNSTISDLHLWTHTDSVRRAISIDSNQFIKTVSGPAAAGALKIQDVVARNWKSNDGAISTSLSGPVSLFDIEFINSDKKLIPIHLNNPKHIQQIALHSNIKSNTSTIIQNSSARNKLINFNNIKIKGNTHRLGNSFIKSVYPISNNIIDVKTNCGAKGDGNSDDTQKIIECIKRAKESTKFNTIYFPSGYYPIKKTLVIDDSNISLEGTGWHSGLIWHGKSAGPLMKIINPRKTKISHLAFGGTANVTRLQITGDKALDLKLNTVYGWSDDQGNAVGFHFKNIPDGSVILAEHIDGIVEIEGTSSATILIGYHEGRKFRVSGPSHTDQFIGVLNRTSCCSDWPLEIYDNQSLVMTDWYNEQTSHLIKIHGNSKTTGSISIDHSKAESKMPLFNYIKNYKGNITLSGGFFGNASIKSPRKILAENFNDTEITLHSNMFWNFPPTIHMDLNPYVNLANNIIERRLLPDIIMDDQNHQNIKSSIENSLDKFRRLSSEDLRLNYCR